MKEGCHDTLFRIRDDDSSLKSLVIGNYDETRWSIGHAFHPSNTVDDFSQLGKAIGANTCLTSMYFYGDDRSTSLNGTATKAHQFLEDIAQNSSIHTIGFQSCHLHETGYRVLGAMCQKNANISSIDLDHCRLGSRVFRSMFWSSVKICQDLRDISLQSCELNDEHLAGLASALRGLRELRYINLEKNNISGTGCNSLAAVLRDPNCNVIKLDLTSNQIDDRGAIILADALRGNSRLKRLILDRNHIITSYAAFEHAIMGGRRNINETFLSNHTLCEMFKYSDAKLHLRKFFRDLASALFHNQGSDKRKIALGKILRYHTHISMIPFFDWEWKFLPVAANWFDMAVGAGIRYADLTEEQVLSKKLSAIYQFIRAMPWMCSVPAQKKGIKKKRRGVKRKTTQCSLIRLFA